MFEQDKCGCGRDVRYSTSDGKGSCNKYGRCLSWEEQAKLIRELQHKVGVYENSLEKIVRVNAMDYEYKCWSKEALNKVQ